MSLSEQEKVAIYDEVSQDKGLFRILQRGLAKKHPDISIPEVEFEDRLEEVRVNAARETEKLREELESERAARSAAESVAQARAEHGLSSAEMAEVSKTMLDNGITSLETGLKFRKLEAAAAAKAEARAAERGRMQLPASFKDAVRDRRGARRKNLYSAIDSLRTEQVHRERLATI